MQFQIACACINDDNNASTSCKNLVNIGRVTSNFTMAKFENCAATQPQFDDCFSFGTLAF